MIEVLIDNLFEDLFDGLFDAFVKALKETLCVVAYLLLQLPFRGLFQDRY